MFKTLLSMTLILISAASLANPWSEVVSRGISEAADRNYVEALRLFEKAANDNEYYGQFQLANLRGNDIDGVKDLKESYAWYNVVVCRNIRDFNTEVALDQIFRIIENMNQEDLEDAEIKAQEYMKKYCD